MHRQNAFIFFLLFAPYVAGLEEKVFTELENGLQKFCDITNYFSEYLENFNDRHIGNSEWGRMLGYEDIKPKIRNTEESRGMKKMSMAMMPLIFHLGASSTWMMLTSIMAAKSVAIGLILLVFKIIVSSAKIASFFTLLKSKHSPHHEYSWQSHGLDRLDTDRSLSEIPAHADWNSYTPGWSQKDPHSAYKTVPSYKVSHESYADVEYEDPKIHIDKKSR